MAVSSNMLPLGTPLPHFTLPDTVSNATVASAELVGKVSVVAFLCNHCPYVKHLRKGIAEFGGYAAERGVAFVAISSNDPGSHPEDGPEAMALEARASGYVFPYLFDASQDVARAFNAACTPEFYVFDAAGKLAYRGRFDGASPKNDVPVTGAELRAAVDALLGGRQPNSDQKPSIGCSIKWRAS
jgi:peroxiredoxin